MIKSHIMKTSSIPLIISGLLTTSALLAGESSESPVLRLNQELAAYYDFSEAVPENGSYKDKSGHGLDLSVVGKAVTQTEGVFGKAVLLDGSYLQAQSNPLNDAAQFTISLWFKTAEPMTNFKLVAAARWSGGNNASGWNVGTHYSEFWADDQQGGLRDEPGWDRRVAFRKDEWNHLVITYDGKHVREFINGHLSIEIRGTGRTPGAGVPMTVGAWMGSFHFHGALDELRIYRRALGDDEIKFLHSAASGISEVEPAQEHIKAAPESAPTATHRKPIQLIEESNEDR